MTEVILLSVTHVYTTINMGSFANNSDGEVVFVVLVSMVIGYLPTNDRSDIALCDTCLYHYQYGKFC